MKHLALFIFLAATLYIGAHGQDNRASLDSLRNIAKNLLSYHSQFTQEKVYLHLDNNGYLPGETIWFKAYVFKASTLLPTDMSQVLYVELLNPDGQMLERKTLPITNGRTYGNFNVDPTLCHSGYYEIRAYTRAMLNWDQSYIFSRVIPFFEPPKDSVNFTDRKINDHEYAWRNMNNLRSAPEAITTDATQKARSTMITFYPEGGHITKGLATNVAYKLTDKDGLPQNYTIQIVDNTGKEVCTSSVFHDGMGVFSIPESWDGGTAKIIDKKGRALTFDLPEARTTGCDLHTSCNKETGLDISVLSSEDMVGKLVGISVTCRTKLLFCSDVTLEKRNSINIPYDKLSDGILQVTLFTPKGQILSERLVWCAPHQASPTMTIHQNAEVYSPFSPIVLDIDLKDTEGKPLQADFSLSVRDADTELSTGGNSMLTEMLMASELKGYIHNPDFYFEQDDEIHAKALDLLMMVQGWRRYSWHEMAGIEPLTLQQPAEDGLMLLGSLTDTHAAEKTLKKYKGVNLNFLMTQNGKASDFDAKTDANGNFAIKLRDFYGDSPTVITITDNKDNRIYTELKINRNFSPKALPYEPLAIASTEIRKDSVMWSNIKPGLFDWRDTIPDLMSNAINLKMVTVTGKRIQYGYKPGLRYTKGANEDYTKTISHYYYNLEEELDKYQDEGRGIPEIWKWLEEKNPNFYFDEGDSTWVKEHMAKYSVDKNGVRNCSRSFGEDAFTASRPKLMSDGRYENTDFSPSLNGDANKANNDLLLQNEVQAGVLRYHNLPVKIIVDGDLQENGRLPIQYTQRPLMNTFRSLVVVENAQEIHDINLNLNGSEITTVPNPREATIFLYSKLGAVQQPYYVKGTRWLTLHGYSKCDDFYSPDYRKSEMPTAADHRRTLYWNPSLVTDEQGKANVIFYSNSRAAQRLHINAQGIAVNGQLFEKKME